MDFLISFFLLDITIRIRQGRNVANIIFSAIRLRLIFFFFLPTIRKHEGFTPSRWMTFLCFNKHGSCRLF